MRRRITTIVAVAGLAVMAPATALASRSTDPRSPDARDAATTLVVPSGVITKAAPAVSAPSSDGGNGFGWTEVGYGAGGLAVLALLGAGAFVAVRGRRRPGTRLAH